MAGGAKRRSSPRQSVAVILLVFSLTPSLTCFSMRELNRNVQQDEDSEDAATEERTGRVLFNGKDLDSPSTSSGASAGYTRLAHVDSAQADDAEMPQQTLQLENAMASEAAWRRMNPSLHCGLSKMKLKLMGPGANQLQLYTGNAHTLPLIKVPKTCGYSLHQNALGLILVVPYDGCSVTQENGYHVLPMSWLETPVKLACPLHPIKLATTIKPTTTPPANPYPYFPYYYPFPHNIWHHHRGKPTVPPTSATTTKPTTTPPAYPYFPYYFPFPHKIWHHHRREPTSATTTKPTTTPPAYPYFPYYFPFAHNIWHHHRREPTAPPTKPTTAPPAYPYLNSPYYFPFPHNIWHHHRREPTAPPTKPTTAPPAYPYLNSPYYFPFPHNIWHHHRGKPTSATTTEPTTPPPANPYPYFPYYFPFPHNIWHHHRRRPHPQMPTVPIQTTTPVPTTCPYAETGGSSLDQNNQHFHSWLHYGPSRHRDFHKPWLSHEKDVDNHQFHWNDLQSDEA